LVKNVHQPNIGDLGLFGHLCIFSSVSVTQLYACLNVGYGL